MKQNKICKSLLIKSKNQLDLFKKRQINQFQGTLKLILGKQIDDVQDIWFEQFRNCPIQQLRELHSNDLAFQYASLIAKASHKLASNYGNFILNENMVFKTTLEEELFVWINPDIFANQTKIFLPQSHQGLISMIKSLLNYFKLWLQTDYTLLTQAKTLEQLQFKIDSQKSKNYSSNAANSTKVESEYYGENHGSNSTSKNMDDKFSYKSKNLGKYTPSVKESQPSQGSKIFNIKIQFKHLFPQNKKNHNISSKHSQSNYENHDEFPQLNTPSNSMSRTTGNTSSKYFPFKTTSANSKKILHLIQRADQNPDQYVSNNIKMDPKKMKEIEEGQKRRKRRQSLNQVGEELDNLFLSNMEEEEQDTQQSTVRKKQFQQLLG